VTASHRVGALLVLGAALALGACATTGATPPSPVEAKAPPEPPPPPPPPQPSARARLAASHNEQAVRLEQSGRLRHALDERRIALTIDPADAVARTAITQLEAMIKRGVAQRIEDGRAALARGSHAEARRAFLGALVLDPNGRAAFDALQTEVRELEFIAHVVRQGDTLASLGQRYYGDRARAEVIGETNVLVPGARLVVGRTLRIPEIPGVPFARAEPRREPARPSEPAPVPAPDAGSSAPEMNPLLLEAHDAFERREYAIALSDLDKLLAASPNNAEVVGLKKQVLYVHGKAQLEAKDYEASYRTLNQLARLDRSYENVVALNAQARGRLIDQRYSHGIRFFREEKLREAIMAWRSVLELDPHHVNAKKNIEQSERLIKGLEERRRK
jgi:tetratricopeptide (TPR) repeat protein